MVSAFNATGPRLNPAQIVAFHSGLRLFLDHLCLARVQSSDGYLHERVRASSCLRVHAAILADQVASGDDGQIELGVDARQDATYA